MIKMKTGVLQELIVGAGLMLVASLPLHAESALDYFTDKDGRYSGPTLEDQVALMDSDRNGYADVFEVRAYLEKQHGKGYQKELLDKWESAAYGKSCSTPFAKELYGDRTQ